MQISAEALLGPLGLTVALIAAVAFLARLLFRYIDQLIRDLTSQRDYALGGWREQTAATKDLTKAVEGLERLLRERSR